MSHFTASLTVATLVALAPVAAQAQAQAQRPALPDGAGKQIAESMCTGCHQTNMITGSSGYTKEGWKELSATMIDLSSVPQDQATLTEYLATNFPPNTRNASKLVARS